MVSHAPTPAGCFPHLSHTMRMTYHIPNNNDTTTPRITSLTILGEPVDLDRVYRIATTTFMHMGGDSINGWTHGVKISGDSFMVSQLALQFFTHLKRINTYPRERVVYGTTPLEQTSSRTNGQITHSRKRERSRSISPEISRARRETSPTHASTTTTATTSSSTTTSSSSSTSLPYAIDANAAAAEAAGWTEESFESLLRRHEQQQQRYVV